MSDRVRVLCVDDNRDAAASTADLLDLHGFETRVCQDGPSALAAVPEFRPHVCLLDLSMPGMNGVEVGTRIREQADWPVKIVALTALWDVNTTLQTKNAGFDAHLVKPVTLDRLLEVVGQPKT